MVEANPGREIRSRGCTKGMPRSSDERKTKLSNHQQALCAKLREKFKRISSGTKIYFVLQNSFILELTLCGYFVGDGVRFVVDRIRGLPDRLHPNLEVGTAYSWFITCNSCKREKSSMKIGR